MAFSHKLSGLGIGLAVLLAGCAQNDIDTLGDMKKEGKEFARNLAKEYHAFAQKESDYNDVIDASHFAVKGQQAATGLNVLPENPNNWDVPCDKLKELLDARERLTFALDHSGRRDFVAPWAAKTQVFYDCWVQEVEEANIFRGRPDQLTRCRDGFHDSIKALEAKIAQYSPAYMVHFDHGSAALRSDSMMAIENAAKTSMHLDEHTVTITGYTDAAGGRKANLVLAQKRAQAVANELMKHGVPKERMNVVGVGEIEGGAQNDQKNRRVTIVIR